MDFGFTINSPRTINIDGNDLTIAQRLLKLNPLLESCIACGNCAATCTAGNFTSFNLRKTHTLLRRGVYVGLYREVSKCMLCGKCRLVCPRGINTREVVMLIKKELHNLNSY